jgi:hypothetical protein
MFPVYGVTYLPGCSTAGNQYWPVQNTIEPLDLNEGILLEQRD